MIEEAKVCNASDIQITNDTFRKTGDRQMAQTHEMSLMLRGGVENCKGHQIIRLDGGVRNCFLISNMLRASEADPATLQNHFHIRPMDLLVRAKTDLAQNSFQQGFICEENRLCRPLMMMI